MLRPLIVMGTMIATSDGGSRYTRDFDDQYMVPGACLSPNMTCIPASNPWPIRATSMPPVIGPSPGMTLKMALCVGVC